MDKVLTEKKDNLFKTITCFYESKEIERFTLEDMLTHIIRVFKEEVQAIMSYLEHSREVDEFIIHILEMINAMETFQMHFEFTLAALGTQSTEEFQILKCKYSSIMEGYENTRSKDDLTPVPAKYVIALMLDKVIAEFNRVLKGCFRKDHYGNHELIKDEENLAWIKILTAKFEVGHRHFAMVINFPKDDIFCLEKSSPLWQDLYSHVTFKEILTKQEVIESSRQFIFYLYISHLIVKNQISNKTSSSHKAVFSLLKDIIYYGLQRKKAEAPALLYLLNADVQEVFKAWNIAEYPLIAKYYLSKTPQIEYDKLIYIPRLFPAITKQVILKEYEENSFNKLAPVDLSKLVNITTSENKIEALQDLFVSREDKLPIRILSDKKLNFQKPTGLFQGIYNRFAGTDADSSSEQYEEAIVIHLHGGGFVALSSGTHRVYLNKWVQKLKLTHFSIDYRLAPANQYPDALDDVWQGYLWIINFASSVLGIKYKKIIIVGDSAGGNLALALMLRLVRAGLNPPDGCLLMYPCLYVDANSFSPSYFESSGDPMLPYALLKLVAKAYVPEGFKNLEDPFISPVLASYELLENLPPIRIVVGSRDPLHDDNWRLLAKLRKLNKDVKMIVHANLSHGFLCHNELKNYDYFVEEGCELIRELISLTSL